MIKIKYSMIEKMNYDQETGDGYDFKGQGGAEKKTA